MEVTGLNLFHFRNINAETVTPCPGINLFYGENGQGKTNLMEAIWLFTGNPSFRGARSREMISFWEDTAKLELSFYAEGRDQNALLQLGKSTQLKLNQVPLESKRELAGHFCAVVFSPEDLRLVKEGPAARRNFLNQAICQLSPKYGDYLNAYEQLLQQRNALLRGHYRNLKEEIGVWDCQLARAGTVLSIYRADYVRKLRPLALRHYEGISKGAEALTLDYASTVFETPDDLKEYQTDLYEQYLTRLSESFEEDLRQGMTTVGIHRDTLSLSLNGHPARNFASQGQQRSITVSLKLSEAALLGKVLAEPPVMLLDDVMSELDQGRQTYLLNRLQGQQVFITCCEEANWKPLQEGRVFLVEEGRVTQRKGV